MGRRDRSTFIDVCQPQPHSSFFVKQSVLTTPGGNGEEGEGYFIAPSSRLLLMRH
ncbi:hypothetical protein Hanom_Chr16g01503991 [Helianthus anomalus]